MTRERADDIYFRAVKKAQVVYERALDYARIAYAKNVNVRSAASPGSGNWNLHCLTRMTRNGSKTRARSSRT